MNDSQNLDKLPEDAIALIAYAFTYGVHGFSPCTSIEVRLDDPMENIIGQGIGLAAHWTTERKYIEHYGHQDWAVVHKDDPAWKELPQDELIQKAHKIMEKLKFKLELGKENIYVQEKSKWIPLKQMNEIRICDGEIDATQSTPTSGSFTGSLTPTPEQEAEWERQDREREKEEKRDKQDKKKLKAKYIMKQVGKINLGYDECPVYENVVTKTHRLKIGGFSWQKLYKQGDR